MKCKQSKGYWGHYDVLAIGFIRAHVCEGGVVFFFSQHLELLIVIKSGQAR